MGRMEEKKEQSLKEEFAEKEADLTEQEKELFRRRKEEITAKWLLLGCFWGAVLGGLINRYLLGGEWLSGIYTGIPLGLLAGLGAGQIFGALERALMLEHIGRYARPEPEKQQPEEQT